MLTLSSPTMVIMMVLIVGISSFSLLPSSLMHRSSPNGLHIQKNLQKKAVPNVRYNNKKYNTFTLKAYTWEDMDIEEDEEPGWYICQCIAGKAKSATQSTNDQLQSTNKDESELATNTNPKLTPN